MSKEVENFVMKNTYAQVARACFYRSPTVRKDAWYSWSWWESSF